MQNKIERIKINHWSGLLSLSSRACYQQLASGKLFYTTVYISEKAEGFENSEGTSHLAVR